MKKIFLVFVVIFAALFSFQFSFAFESQNSNYKTIGTIGLGEIAETQSADYKTNAIMPNLLTGEFESANYKTFLGPYYLRMDLSEYEILFFDLNLVSGWNLISLPIIPENNSISSIMNVCSYNKIWQYDNIAKNWKSTDSGLTDMNIYNGYWIDRNGQTENCIIQIKGILPNLTVINISSGWNLVGYPSITQKSITYIINSTDYDSIWLFNKSSGWSSTDTGLVTFLPGKGYYIDTISAGDYFVFS